VQKLARQSDVELKAEAVAQHLDTLRHVPRDNADFDPFPAAANQQLLAAILELLMLVGFVFVPLDDPPGPAPAVFRQCSYGGSQVTGRQADLCTDSLEIECRHGQRAVHVEYEPVAE